MRLLDHSISRDASGRAGSCAVLGGDGGDGDVAAAISTPLAFDAPSQEPASCRAIACARSCLFADRAASACSAALLDEEDKVRVAKAPARSLATRATTRNATHLAHSERTATQVASELESRAPSMLDETCAQYSNVEGPKVEQPEYRSAAEILP